MSTALKIIDGRLGIASSRARMPFRFGVVTMRAAAEATLELEVEIDGARVRGYAADMLAYKWFDKRPEKTPADNVADLIQVVERAIDVARGQPAGPFFEVWRAIDAEVDRASVAAGFNRLGASFGTSMVERAMIDALGRHLGKPVFDMVRDGDLGIDPGAVMPALAGRSVAEILPAAPARSLHLRHTVGLVDPIDDGDLPAGKRIGDGLPESLRDYLDQDGISYLKVKVGGNLDEDLERLEKIASLTASMGVTPTVTLDGNEQYRSLDGFAALIEAVRERGSLADFYRSILFIEQPLERSVALSGPLDPRALEIIGKPLLIDEADGWTTAYSEAVDLGYFGVSHKNCKGVTRSMLNALLARKLNETTTGGQGRYFMSAEDLTCRPVVSLQADLAVVAMLGIDHVERNGHHYFHGLDHLPTAEAEAALQAHGDLYERTGGSVALRIDGGDLAIGSLQVPGMGFTPLPDMSAREAPSSWQFASLEMDAKP
ncbi:hypothetical protein [Fodinicurvata sp. EGI_FJ10296]|uniref:hypothetical protein n=1 Tax=Fodinicurvata sp. EGI_FJ10296 TaxID=3231908 RepID=UPI0034563F44